MLDSNHISPFLEHSHTQVTVTFLQDLLQQVLLPHYHSPKLTSHWRKPKQFCKAYHVRTSIRPCFPWYEFKSLELEKQNSNTWQYSSVQFYLLLHPCSHPMLQSYRTCNPLKVPIRIYFSFCFLLSLTFLCLLPHVYLSFFLHPPIQDF